jgi:hypothetical protein
MGGTSRRSGIRNDASGSTVIPVAPPVQACYRRDVASVHVVAIVALATPPEAEAAALAADLGTTAYEVLLGLRGGLPAVVLTTTDAGRAATVTEQIRARGHRALACDTATVIPHAAMISMRRFRLGPEAVTLADQPAERLPYADVLALVRATHRRRVDVVSETTERKLRPGMALATGGLVLSKKVTRRETTTTDERRQVLYVFRRGGHTPWLLEEEGTHWDGLGAERAPAAITNFLTTIGHLRARAPGVAYDERLVAPRKVPERITQSGAQRTEVSAADGIDLLAHLLAFDRRTTA